MGRSPTSNIASSVGSRLFEPVRRRADAREPTLLADEPPCLQTLVRERRKRLGNDQARLCSYWSGCYTDDTITVALGHRRAALIARDVVELNAECNVWIAEPHKCPLGTCVDHIGVRLVVNGGFGTLSPSKRVRALAACRGAASAQLTPTDFEAGISLLGFVVDAVFIDRALLNGMGRQLAVARRLSLPRVQLSASAVAQMLEIEFFISTRASASFAAAVPDALVSNFVSPPSPPIVLSSDACTGSHDPDSGELVDERGALDPAIFGHAHGIAFRLRLEGPWRRLHITVTETVGAALCAIEFSQRFTFSRYLAQTDVSASYAFLRGRSSSECLQRL